MVILLAVALSLSGDMLPGAEVVGKAFGLSLVETRAAQSEKHGFESVRAFQIPDRPGLLITLTLAEPGTFLNLDLRTLVEEHMLLSHRECDERATVAATGREAEVRSKCEQELDVVVRFPSRRHGYLFSTSERGHETESITFESADHLHDVILEVSFSSPEGRPGLVGAVARICQAAMSLDAAIK